MKYIYFGSGQELTVGPANREVPESAIAAHPPAQNPAKRFKITPNQMRSMDYALVVIRSDVRCDSTS